MKPNRTDLEAMLKRAIDDSGLTKHAVAKAAGLDAAQVLRFMSGERTLTLPAASKLTAFFNLELRPAGEPGRRGKTRKGW